VGCPCISQLLLKGPQLGIDSFDLGFDLLLKFFGVFDVFELLVPFASEQIELLIDLLQFESQRLSPHVMRVFVCLQRVK